MGWAACMPAHYNYPNSLAWTVGMPAPPWLLITREFRLKGCKAGSPAAVFTGNTFQLTRMTGASSSID